MFACAFAAVTPAMNAKALKPPIKASFITSPPFRQKTATVFIGSINERKIKEARPASAGIFERGQGKIRIKLKGQSAAQAWARCPDAEEPAQACLPRRRRAVRVRDAMLDVPLTRPPGCPAPDRRPAPADTIPDF
jgi:hypothetical protein